MKDYQEIQDGDKKPSMPVLQLSKIVEAETIGLRLAGVEQLKKEKGRDRLDCQRGLSSCNPEVTEQIHPERRAYLRKRGWADA